MSWHLYYDYEPQWRAHVCDFHRARAQQIGCRDQRPDGDCDHVQHRPCDCTEWYPCAACPDDVEIVA